MIPLKITLTLRAPLGTPLAGDTLFGQLCHATREAGGDCELGRLLDGYTAGHPWLVVGDGLPAGHLPRPTIPTACAPSDRKAAKTRRWIPSQAAALPLPAMLAAAVSDEAAHGTAPAQIRAHHNTLNRFTGTTGSGAFAPYTAPQIHHATGQRIDVWCALDESRCDRKRLAGLLGAIGASGYGRDASIGLGKFDVAAVETAVPPAPTLPAACWTLGPCAPQRQGFDGERSHWRVITRFGRHGGALALSANPFKNPVLLAAAGAVLVPRDGYTQCLFVGQGLTGVSRAEAATVHQGYAPVLPLQTEAAL